MSLFHERKDPFEPLEMLHDVRLMDLAYDRLILNNIRAEETEYVPIIPKLALFDMVKYCAQLNRVPKCDRALAKSCRPSSQGLG